MNVKDVYISKENHNNITIVTKFTKKVAKELLENILGIDIVKSRAKYTTGYDLVLRSDSIYRCKEYRKILLATEIPWSKLIAINIDTKNYRISIDTRYTKINNYFRNGYKDNLNPYIPFTNYLYSYIKSAMLIFKRLEEDMTEFTDDYLYYIEDAIKFCLESPNRTVKDLFEFSRDYKMYESLEDWDYIPSVKAAEFYMFLGVFEMAIEPYREYLSIL